MPLIWAPWFYSHTVGAPLTATRVRSAEVLSLSGAPDLDVKLTGCDLLALKQGRKEAFRAVGEQEKLLRGAFELLALLGLRLHGGLIHQLWW